MSYETTSLCVHLCDDGLQTRRGFASGLGLLRSVLDEVEEDEFIEVMKVANWFLFFPLNPKDSDVESSKISGLLPVLCALMWQMIPALHPWIY